MTPRRICKFFIEDCSLLDMPWSGQPLANMQHYALKSSKKYASYEFHTSYASFVLKATYFRSWQNHTYPFSIVLLYNILNLNYCTVKLILTEFLYNLLHLAPNSQFFPNQQRKWYRFWYCHCYFHDFGIPYDGRSIVQTLFLVSVLKKF